MIFLERVNTQSRKYEEYAFFRLLIKQNLYKKRLRVYFLKFIRKDQKFKNSAELVRQMNKDVILAKKGLKTKLVL